MSSLSDLLPAGGGGKNVNFVASGVLPNGQAVVLKANGQVEAVVETAVSQSIPAGSQATFNPANSSFGQVAFDPSTSNKFVIAYRGANGGATPEYGFAVVGTVSGTSISFGTPVVFNSAGTNQLVLAYDPDSAGKFVVMYSDNGNSGRQTGVVGTVSGTSVSFGSEYVVSSGHAGPYQGISFIPNTPHKFVVSFSDQGSSSNGTIVIGTVSGTALSYGAKSVFHSGSTTWTALDFNPNAVNTFVVAYNDPGNSDYGTAVVGTISGASISYGSEYVFNTAGAVHIKVNFDHATGNKFAVTWEDEGNSSYGTGRVGTVSGTNISFGSKSVFNSSDTQYGVLQFDPNTLGTFVLGYIDASNADAKVIVGSISGTTLSYGSSITMGSNNSEYASLDFNILQAGQFVLSYRDSTGGIRGVARLGQIATTSTTLTATNFLGITDAAVASGASGSVTIKGGLKTGLAGGTFAVTVANPGAGNRYYINGVLQQTLNLREGFTYKFDQSASSNSGHPFRFSTTSNGTHAGGSEYTTGVTTSGTPGNAGAYTQIVVAASAPTLYYYCSVHSLMGGQANTIAAIVANSIYYVQADGSISTVSTSPAVRIGRAFSPTSINLEFS